MWKIVTVVSTSGLNGVHGRSVKVVDKQRHKEFLND
jgi:hypothetical protein